MILVTTVAAVLVAGLYIAASRLWFRQDLAATTLGATSSGYVNSNNLGLPVAVYILGDAAYVAPLILMQVVVYTPLILAILETTRGNRKGAAVALGRAASNPIILASVLGFVCAMLQLHVPVILLSPIQMLGTAAVPMVLLSFGISLRGQRALQPGSGRKAVLVASTIKVLVMPPLTWAICLAVGMNPHETFVATTIAALPTAQNVYNYAATYRRAETQVRDTVFITTFASLPMIALIAWLLSVP
ncbi:AEC family transporter [Leucobacter soli]|uniref:AEC family transporter n=1 Tax=Leucobacter soli TaxID=2812850 RepID=UPI0036122660